MGVGVGLKCSLPKRDTMKYDHLTLFEASIVFCSFLAADLFLSKNLVQKNQNTVTLNACHSLRKKIYKINAVPYIHTRINQDVETAS